MRYWQLYPGGSRNQEEAGIRTDPPGPVSGTTLRRRCTRCNEEADRAAASGVAAPGVAAPGVAAPGVAAPGMAAPTGAAAAPSRVPTQLVAITQHSSSNQVYRNLSPSLSLTTYMPLPPPLKLARTLPSFRSTPRPTPRSKPWNETPQPRLAPSSHIPRPSTDVCS